jgi:hypothetical protein
VCIELKHPTINLGKKQLSQVKDYKDVILSQDEFNGSNTFWDFYLIGNGYDTSNYIENEKKNSKHHGEESLVYFVDNYKIYVKTWSEVFNEFEIKHNFLNEKLKLKLNKLMTEQSDANEIVQSLSLNSAIRPSQIVISS